MYAWHSGRTITSQMGGATPRTGLFLTTHVAEICGRHESGRVVLTKLTVVSGASEDTVATIRTRSNIVTCSALLTRMIPTLVSYKPTHWQPRCTDLIYIVSGKSAAIFLPLTLPNVDRFSKFFQQRTYQQICGKAVMKYLSRPQMRRYTTLWNINVRKKSKNLKHDIVW